MKESMPIVSIIIPVYNAEKYIVEAIESVLNQTFKLWELLIINDGSTDTTAEILATFGDERIRIFRQENKGVSVARNRGLEEAKGEYIMFLDADDCIPSYAMEEKVDYLDRHQNIDMVHGEIIVYNENFQEEICTFKTFLYKNLLQKILLLDNKLSFNIGYMLRANKLDNIRFVEDMTHSEDILFLIKLCVQKMEYAFIPSPMYFYQVRKNSLMSDMEGWRRGYFSLLNHIDMISEISYRNTLIMRVKILKMLLLWHIRNKNIAGIFDIFRIFKRRNIS